MSNSFGRSLAEAIGTFMLVFVGTGAIIADAATDGALGIVGIALAFGLVVAAMVYAVGHVSGAHINPAVTLAMWSCGRAGARQTSTYVLAQCVGAIAAALLWRSIVGIVGLNGATVPSIPAAGAFALEWVMTFALMFVIMAVATDERAVPGFTGIAIGAAVAFDALIGGAFTGASMNPARTLGPAVAAGVWEAHWIYWLAPITGAMAAVRAYALVRGKAPNAGASS